MKKLFFLLCLCAIPSFAGQITPGATWVDGERPSASKLNLFVTGATINSTFFSTQTASTTPSTAYNILLLDTSGAAYYRSTLANAVFSHDSLVNGQTELTSFDTNDWFLAYDTSAAANVKVKGTNLFKADYLINGRTETNAPSATATFLAYDNSAYWKTSRSNLFNGAWVFLGGTNGFTNLSLHTTLTNVDRLLIFDGTAGTNKSVALTNLMVGGYASNTNKTNSDVFAYYNSASNAMAKMTLGDLKHHITNDNSAFSKSSNTNVVPVASGFTNIAHGLGGIPHSVRVVLICTGASASGGYSIGDEVDIFNAGSTADNTFAVITDATNVRVARNDSGVTITPKAGGTVVSLDAELATKWGIKAYCVYFP